MTTDAPTRRTYRSSIPLDVLRLGADARVPSSTSKSRNPNFYLPKGNEIVLQFLSQPTDSTGTGWFTYRVAQVKSILVPGVWSGGEFAGTARAQLPWQLQDVVMDDTEPVMVNGRQLYRFTYPQMEVAPGVMKDILKEVLDGRSQSFSEKRGGRTQVETQVLTNVVVWEWPDLKKKDGSPATKPEVGAHIGLRLTKKQADMLTLALITKVKEAAAEDRELDVLDYRWSVEFTAGQSPQLTLIKRSRITEPLDIELYDFESQVLDRMDAFEEHVKAAYADLNGPGPDETEADQPEWSKPDPAEQAEAVDLFSMLATSVLRQRLKAAGVTIPPGTSRGDLLVMAAEHLS